MACICSSQGNGKPPHLRITHNLQARIIVAPQIWPCRNRGRAFRRDSVRRVDQHPVARKRRVRRLVLLYGRLDARVNSQAPRRRARELERRCWGSLGRSRGIGIRRLALSDPRKKRDGLLVRVAVCAQRARTTVVRARARRRRTFSGGTVRRKLSVYETAPLAVRARARHPERLQNEIHQEW